MSSEPTLTVTARPIRTARVANVCAAIAFLAFLVTALLMQRHSAGAHFGRLDPWFTILVGLIIAGGLRMPTRPRLVADLDSIRTRSYLGGYRTIPWSVVVAVEFPRKNRFARVRLPGEETLALYAVQRMDRQDAVRTMQGLRTLFALVNGTTHGEQTAASDAG